MTTPKPQRQLDAPIPCEATVLPVVETHTKPHSITRRGLFRSITSLAAAGLFYSLPRVDDGFFATASEVLGPTVALGESEAYFTFEVVALDEVGIQVVDVSPVGEGKDAVPVNNVTVILKSRGKNAKTVTGVTDEDGKVILNIGDLAMRDDDGELVGDRYQCHAEITFDTKKSHTRLREFSIGLTHLEGASAYVLGAHKLESDDKYYLERLSFDDWDILYTKNCFVRSEENDLEHTVRARFKATDNLNVSLGAAWKKDNKDCTWYSGESRTYHDSDSGYYVAEFKGKFLQLDSDDPAEPHNGDMWDGDEIQVTVMYAYDDDPGFSSTGIMYTEEAPVKGSKYEQPLVPFLMDNETLGTFSIGNEDWPCFNNCDISIVNFEFPAHLSASPYDLMISFGSDFQVTDDDGHPSMDTWKKSHREDLREAFKQANDKYTEGLAKFGKTEPFKDKNGLSSRKAFAKKFDMKTMLQLVFGVQWDGFTGEGTDIKKTFAGKLGFGAGVSMKGSFTWEFMAGPVPCYFTITPGLEATGSLMFTCTRELALDEDLDMNKFAFQSEWVPAGAVSFNIRLSLKLTFGVGIDDVLCASVSGGASLHMYLGWGEARPRDDLDPTHFTVGASFKAEICLQMICLSVSINVWSHEWDPFYDNWKKASGTLDASCEDAWGDYSSARFLLTQPDGTKRHTINVVRMEDGSYVADGDVFQNLRLVTMSDMANSFEASASDALSSVMPTAMELPTVHRNRIPVLVRLEDGTLATKLVECEGVNTFSYDDEATAIEDEEELAGAVQEDEGAEVTTDETAEDEPTTEEVVADEPGTDESTEDEPAEGEPGTDGPEDVEPTDDEPVVDESADDESGSDEPLADEPQADAVVGAAGLLGLVNRTTGESTEGEADEEAAPESEPTDEQAAPEGKPTDEQVAHEEAADEDAAAEGEDASDEDAVDPQADDPFLGDTYLGFGSPVVPEYEYVPVEGKTTGAVCKKGSVNSIAEHDGIVPDVDVVIYKDVFSDPRSRVVDIDGTLYLFRIMTVDYSVSGKAIRRTRVVACAFDEGSGTWGEPTVIEYNSGNTKLRRIDIFDYDFDIVVRSAGSTWTRNVYACLVVTGGLRPNGDGTTAAEACTTPTVSVVLLRNDLTVYQRAVNQASEMYNDGLAHMLVVPHVCDGFAVSDASGVLAISYLHRSAASADDIMTDHATVTFGIGYCYVLDGELSITFNKTPVLYGKNPPEPVSLDPSITGMEMVGGSGVDGKYDSLVTLLFRKDQGYEVYSAVIPPAGSFADLQVRQCIDSSETLPHITAWPRHGTFLFTKYRGEDKQTSASDYYLYAATIDPLATGQAGFEANPTRVDINGFRGGTFCVSPTGAYVFYAECFKGIKGYDVDPKTGKKTPVEDEINRIMASKYMDTEGGFCEDFPFCELSHSIDGFEVMTIEKEESVFLVNEITDANLSLSQLRYVAVPHAKAAEIEGFTPLDPFVCAGKSCDFQIDVRNHGNVPIGGFDVTMYDPKKGNREVGTYTVQEIDPKNVLETAHSQRDWLDTLSSSSEGMDGTSMGWRPSTVTADEDMIMPGELLSYRVSFDIPENWPDDITDPNDPNHHKKRVMLGLSNVWSPGIMVEPLEDVESYLHEGVFGTLEISSVDAFARLQNPREKDLNEDNPKPEPKPEPKPDPKPKPLPQTSDLLGGVMAPLGLALGGLGSLAGAYSMRRMEVEREEREAAMREDDVQE